MLAVSAWFASNGSLIQFVNLTPLRQMLLYQRNRLLCFRRGFNILSGLINVPFTTCVCHAVWPASNISSVSYLRKLAAGSHHPLAVAVWVQHALSLGFNLAVKRGWLSLLLSLRVCPSSLSCALGFGLPLWWVASSFSFPQHIHPGLSCLRPASCHTTLFPLLFSSPGPDSGSFTAFPLNGFILALLWRDLTSPSFPSFFLCSAFPPHMQLSGFNLSLL